MEDAGSFDCCCSHRSVASPSLFARDTAHIVWYFHGSVCKVNAENLGFYCLTFVYRQNVTCLKRFIRYGHYAGDVEDIIIARLAVLS